MRKLLDRMLLNASYVPDIKKKTGLRLAASPVEVSLESSPSGRGVGIRSGENIESYRAFVKWKMKKVL
jgi:hypothetical protein